MHEEERRAEKVKDLRQWRLQVGALASRQQRHLQLLTLYTGLRSSEARRIRYQDISWARSMLTIIKPKGGERRAFELPLPEETMRVVEVQAELARATHTARENPEHRT